MTLPKDLTGPAMPTPLKTSAAFAISNLTCRYSDTGSGVVSDRRVSDKHSAGGDREAAPFDSVDYTILNGDNSRCFDILRLLTPGSAASSGALTLSASFAC